MLHSLGSTSSSPLPSLNTERHWRVRVYLYIPPRSPHCGIPRPRPKPPRNSIWPAPAPASPLLVGAALAGAAVRGTVTLHLGAIWARGGGARTGRLGAGRPLQRGRYDLRGRRREVRGCVEATRAQYRSEVIRCELTSWSSVHYFSSIMYGCLLAKALETSIQYSAFSTTNRPVTGGWFVERRISPRRAGAGSPAGRWCPRWSESSSSDARQTAQSRDRATSGSAETRRHALSRGGWKRSNDDTARAGESGKQGPGPHCPGGECPGNGQCESLQAQLTVRRITRDSVPGYNYRPVESATGRTQRTGKQCLMSWAMFLCYKSHADGLLRFDKITTA